MPPAAGPQDASARDSLEAAVASGKVLPQSIALYARWWQLETWLRELAYVELRASLGVAWEGAVTSASGRQSLDAAFTHMHSADTENPLAYLDFSRLTELIDKHWEQMGYALLERSSWRGRLVELSRIRHRIAHVRTPHADDLNRLEQALRDLERGAFIAFASYNDGHLPAELPMTNAVVRGWLRGKHPTAQRLIEHAKRQYETRLRLRLSRRPWSSWEQQDGSMTGLLWHADFLMRERTVDVRTLWHDDQLDVARALLVHLRADSPWHVGFTFSGADAPEDVSYAIGVAFDTVLDNSQPGFIDDDAQRRWQERATLLDYRVHTHSGWNIIERNIVPVSIFGVGGGVESVPRW